MAEERTNGSEPLTASIGEQLGEKVHLDEERDEERRASEVQKARVERRKAGERETAQAHAAASPPRTLSARLAAPLADRWGARPWTTALAAAGAGLVLGWLLPRRR